MSKFLILLFVLFKCHSVAAQVITLKPDEKLQDAVRQRLAAVSQRFDTIRLFRINDNMMQVGTAYTADGGDEVYLLSYIYRPLGQNRYQQTFIDSQGINGGLAELVTMFSANADSDKSAEIVALYKWRVRQYDTEGFIYEVKCYKKSDSASDHLVPLSVQPEMNCGFEGWRYGKNEHARYTTEAGIRRRLKQLGFRQASR